MIPAWVGILVHHSAGRDTPAAEVETYRRQHRAQGWRDVGYHALVEEVGDELLFVAGRPLHWEGSHCPGKNRTHLGVCFVGNFSLEPPSDRMLGLAAQHLAGWCAQFGIHPEAIQPHRAFRATECPGDLFPMDRLRTLVRAYLAG